MKRSVKACATVAVSALLSACGTGSTPSVPPLDAVFPVTEVSQVTRPLDAYLPTAQQIKALGHAAYLVTADCVKGFGIPADLVRDPSLAAPASDVLRTRLYGFFGPDIASTRGYDAIVIPATGIPTPQSDVAQKLITGQDKTGAPVTEYQGRKVPPGGCWKVGLDAVGGSVPFPGDVSALPGGGPKEPLDDPRIVDAVHKWSSCMKSHGFVYANPGDAYMDPRWREETNVSQGSVTHTPAEVATATADMECKQATNYMGTAVAVQAAYDKQYIATNAAQLKTFEQHLGQHIADAERIIAGSGAK